MNPAFRNTRKAGFTFVELLLAITLGILVAAILAALVHGLLAAGDGQSARAHGPFAARAAVRTLSREVSCAFAPPLEDVVPMQLSTSTEPDKPQVTLSFYAPRLAAPRSLHGYDIEQVTYEVMPVGQDHHELRRISVPCSGPLTNAPVTNQLFNGRFTLSIVALTNGTDHVEWPLLDTEEPTLPTSLRLSLSLPGEAPFQTEALIQTALGIESPVEREPEDSPKE